MSRTSRLFDPQYLKLWLPLNGHTDDISGNGNDGTGSNLEWTEGANGKTVAAFDGTETLYSGYIASTNISNISYSGCARHDGNFSSFAENAILSDRSDTSRIIQCYLSGDGDFVAQYSTSEGLQVCRTTSTFAETGEEFKFAVTIDADSGILYIYKNGVLFESFSISGAPISNDTKVYIGREAPGGRQWDGIIHSVYIYENTFLTAEEVAYLHNMPPMKSIGPASQPLPSLPDISDSSLIGAWGFKGSGQTAKDISGNGNDGTLMGDTIIGKDGEFVFDGEEDYVNILDLDFADGSSWTYSLWIKTVSEGDAWQILNGVAFSDNSYINIRTSTDPDEIHFNDGAGTNNRLTTNEPLVNRWNHLVFVSDGTDVYLYQNGDSGRAYSVDSTKFDFNGISYDFSTYGFNGSIDEVMIFNRALSEDEIKLLYNQRVPDSSLVLSTLHTDATDRSRYGREGTVVGAIVGGGYEFGDISGHVWYYMPSIESRTICFTFKADEIDTNHRLYDWDRDTVDARFDSNDKIKIGNSYGSSVENLTSTTVIETGKPYRLMVVASQNSQKIYINGVLDAEQSYGSELDSILSTLKLFGGGGGEALRGNGKDVQIYNEAKSAKFAEDDYKYWRRFF